MQSFFRKQMKIVILTITENGKTLVKVPGCNMFNNFDSQIFEFVNCILPDVVEILTNFGKNRKIKISKNSSNT